MFISRPGKVLDIKSPKFVKSPGNVLYSYVHLRRLIIRIKTSVNM